MTENVVQFWPRNAALNPDAVLERAIGKYDSVITIGYDHCGELDVRASTNITCDQIVFMIEAFKHRLFSGAYSGD